MKKIVVGALALAFAAAPAMAADLPVKAMPVPVEVLGWTGFYIGGNVGGLWAHTTVTDVNAAAANAVAGTVTTLNRSGFLAGGQVGYNWQHGPVVFGFEGDGGWMGFGRTTLLTGSTSNTLVGLHSVGYGDITVRAGWAFDRSLLYVKGGFAFMNNAASFSTLTPGVFPAFAGGNSGGVIGAGWEYRFDRNWSAKIEYMHFDFGHSLDYTVTTATGATFAFNQGLTVETVKFGINYQLGGPVPR